LEAEQRELKKRELEGQIDIVVIVLDGMRQLFLK